MPAPEGVSVTLSAGTFTITWNAVAGAARYETQQRIGTTGDNWESVGTTTTATTITYSPTGGPACGTTYQFRVRAFGDGTMHTAAWGEESAPDSVTSEACNRDPEFDDAPYLFSVAENATTTTLVGTVSATDLDDDPVTYLITEGNSDGKFSLGDVSGEVTVVDVLDYETISSYTLTVEASDGRGGTATTTVEITVTDVAEDPPPAPSGLSVSLAEGTFTITWTALDGAARYEVQHRVEGSGDDWTSLPETTGTSVTYSPTDGPACGTTYEFRVRAFGDGDTYTEMWGVESATVTVETANCDPEFAPSSYSFSIPENAASRTLVGTVLATDEDGDPVTYLITAGNSDGKFSLGDVSGEVTVADVLDYETISSYTLTVEATDGRGGTATTTVEITVTDVAEDPPPAPSGLSVSLTDSTFTTTWTALDGAARYEVQHHVAESEDYWTSLPETTGTSVTYSPTDGPACGTTYEFRVRAFGDGDTYTEMWGVESAVESVTTPACNRAPSVDSSTYSFSIAETATTTALVGTVSATDPDDDALTYAITGGNEDGKFDIGSGTGQIAVAGTLDPDAAVFHVLTVKASGRAEERPPRQSASRYS